MEVQEIFINRYVEREIFREMLKCKDNSPRLLTIQSRGGTGKTFLLKRLRYECHYILDIPCSLISMDDNIITEPFDIVKAIRNDYKNFDETIKFRKFDILDSARMLKNPEPFTEAISKESIYVNVESAEIKDQAIVAAKIDAIIQNIENLNLTLQSSEWANEEYETFVRKYCIDAFFEDLKVICQEKTVVIIFDVFEKCNPQLKRWIMRPLLHLHCFQEIDRPRKLVFVMAGRELLPFKERLGDQYSNLVENIEKLSEWSVKHMREFLQVHGFKNLSDKEIETITERVNTKGSLEQALIIAKAYEL